MRVFREAKVDRWETISDSEVKSWKRRTIKLFLRLISLWFASDLVKFITFAGRTWWLVLVITCDQNDDHKQKERSVDMLHKCLGLGFNSCMQIIPLMFSEDVEQNEMILYKDKCIKIISMNNRT